MGSEIRGKPATELRADDVVACTECGSILWVPGLKVEAGLFGDESVACPQCGTVLFERDRL